MNKTNNLKIEFSKILEEKYNLSKESIEGYWANKEKEKQYDRKSDICFCLGITGAYSGAALFGYALYSGRIEGVAIATAAFLEIAISSNMAIAHPNRNPYKLKENEEIDLEYKKFKSLYKKKKHEK